MANPWAGEVALVVDGERRAAKLTLGALAELEDALEAGSLVALIERFEEGAFTTRDVILLVTAGLRGGGWEGTAGDLLSAEIEGGPVEAARAGRCCLPPIQVTQLGRVDRAMETCLMTMPQSNRNLHLASIWRRATACRRRST